MIQRRIYREGEIRKCVARTSEVRAQVIERLRLSP